MKPIREICERCKQSVDIDLHRFRLEQRLKENRCMFILDSHTLKIFVPYYEPAAGVVPDFCPYSAEIAVSQETK